ncbi:NAD(P)/FAD-dependent oxidoreductase [Pseudomonas jessenii]|nr:FAD-binding oxidoreductase [Pseudomonas jessenii]
MIFYKINQKKLHEKMHGTHYQLSLVNLFCCAEYRRPRLVNYEYITMKVKLLPNDDHTNGWSAIAPSRAVHAPASGNKSFDWLIIGGGYAGLSAARRLAEIHPEQSIAILEAGVIGDNASGRNSGFAIDLPHQVGHPDVEGGRRYARMSREGIKYLENSVIEHNIKCDWVRQGKLHCAVSKSISSKLLKPDIQLLEKMGEPFNWLTREEIAATTGLTHYHSGVYTPGTALLNPAALVQGLADNLPGNVEVYEQSPVIELITEGGISAKTASAVVTAKRLILAVNGFAGKFGYMKNRLLPFVLFASLTKKMTEEQQQLLAGHPSWGITPALGTVGPTLRRTVDQRLLIRGGFAFSPSFRYSERNRSYFKEMHRNILVKRFPTLAKELDIEHFWMGWLTMTGNGAPGFGMVEESVYCAVGCGGVGIARQTAAGMAIADLATGNDSQMVSDMMSLGQPCSLPGRPIIDLGVNAYLLKEKLSGRIEA